MDGLKMLKAWEKFICTPHKDIPISVVKMKFNIIPNVNNLNSKDEDLNSNLSQQLRSLDYWMWVWSAAFHLVLAGATVCTLRSSINRDLKHIYNCSCEVWFLRICSANTTISLQLRILVINEKEFLQGRYPENCL